MENSSELGIVDNLGGNYSLFFFLPCRSHVLKIIIHNTFKSIHGIMHTLASSPTNLSFKFFKEFFLVRG